MAGQVATSHATADGYTSNAGSSANPGSASSSTDEASGRGSPNAMTPSDNARRDSCPPSKTSVDEPKGPTSRTTRAKSRQSVGSVRKQNAPSDHHDSKVSISSKVSNLMSSTSLHKSASISSARTVVSASTSPIGSVTPVCAPRHFNAATQNQLTPELYPASPVPDAGAAVRSDAAGTQRRHLKHQLCGRSIPGSELLLRGDSKEDLEKGEGKEKAHAEAAKNVAETPEEKGKPEKFAEAKKQRKKAPRGLKMPDGTYVGLNEKNRYLRQVCRTIGLVVVETGYKVAMYKEHLKCDYVPFCILGVLMVVVVALVYLYAFRPVRNLLGVNTKDEEQDDPASIHNVPSNSRPAAARAPTPTTPYSRNVTPPAYGVFAPHTMAAPYTYAVPQPELSTSYHYVPVPCAGVWPQPQHPTGAPLVAAVELAGLYRPSSPPAAQPLPPSAFVRKETLASVARCSNSSPRRRSTGRYDKP
ncbi:hypothetical protein HPB51_017058 [Rhipicephalus microplus]|uniref:Transmembrane protein n=1 Tax=Rhipicephalus microplus TaxID=6941 RepID=A0A9J6F5T9_RHIMP|nr:hypothetical protein HPB51_017058 [Rhipicephalus microplus]